MILSFPVSIDAAGAVDQHAYQCKQGHCPADHVEPAVVVATARHIDAFDVFQAAAAVLASWHCAQLRAFSFGATMWW